MKLTKSELFSIIDSVDDLLEDIDHNNEKLAEKVSKLHSALYEDNFEIEGDERSGWTRLDPDDPKTYPKKNTPVLFASYNPIDKWGMLAEIASDDVIDNWKNISRLFGVVFWREVMFPEPPVETEEAK